MRLILPLLFALSLPAVAQRAGKTKTPIKLTDAEVATKEVVYKTTPQGELKLHVFSPKGEVQIAALRPCVVFFFGGGWKSGSYLQFVPQAEYLASRGIIAISADYRIANIHKTTPDKAVEDAKSAIRWVRGHATELGIDPDKVIAGGGSAGGHLAACTALVKAYDAESDDKSISAKPNAMVLFNPAMNIATLFKQRDTGDSPITLDMAEAITPNNFVSKDTPPAILFFGTADKLKAGGDEYIKKARELGLRAEMWAAADMPHGFFNRAPWIQVTAKKMDEFLISLGYLGGDPTIKLPENAPELKAE
ncbi:MAG: alpha/beta hydrolase [Prosthecobacter sp.]|jgi:acetyl esterase|uniref:alpha/beta hydrolase n=1 Tax=Prosthecobacter sp. TaxID=1965333 RepID=UPI0019E6FC65|nr:alpha/beta hydrolase [Prosthecobacter sp.]MBE2284667.1 alpha/beta hydrolase [Prosthecobacter sp.]